MSGNRLTPPGQETVREAILDLIVPEAGACGMRIISGSIHGVDLATDKMNGGNESFKIMLGFDTFICYVLDGTTLELRPVGERVVSIYDLTREQVFFMNWLFKWYNTMKEWCLKKSSMTLKDLEALIETCKEDHEDVVPYPQGGMIKSASKV